MTRGRISAIITCRDLGRTLVEALGSLERQTRPAADIVIVDDASTDVYTLQVIAQLKRGGTYVAGGPGRGASAARNLGARLTSGDYLVWLDADDTLEPGYLQTAGARLDEDPTIDFVSCAMRGFGDGQYVWAPSSSTWVEAVATNAVPHASTLIRRSLWETLGGFDETLKCVGDYEYWLRIAKRGTIRKLNEFLAVDRLQHEAKRFVQKGLLAEELTRVRSGYGWDDSKTLRKAMYRTYGYMSTRSCMSHFLAERALTRPAVRGDWAGLLGVPDLVLPPWNRLLLRFLPFLGKTLGPWLVRNLPADTGVGA